MIELFHESFRLVNLPYTIFFGLAVLYWALYFLGILGADLLDAGLDGDGGADMGADAGGGLGSMLSFVYAADVPMTIILSVLSFAMWAISIVVNYYTGNTSMLLSLALALPVFAGGVVTTRLVLKPFLPLLKAAFDESSDAVEVLGQLCVVTSLEATPKHGQAEIPLKGSPLVLNVQTRDGLVLKKGDEAVVVGRQDDGTYIIAAFGGENRD